MYSLSIDQITFSLSPLIILPLVGPSKKVVKVKTLFDSGSGSNWIARPLLNSLVYNKMDNLSLKVHTFGKSMNEEFQAVEVLIQFDDGNRLALKCLVIKEFMVHIVVPGIKDFILRGS